jgi:hypothetical protein
MGYGQLRDIDHGFAIEQNVHIDCARALRTVARSTASRALNSLDDGQELQGEVSGFAGCNEIQEPRLIGHLLRFGFVEGRWPEHVNPFGFETIQSFFDIPSTVSEI